MEFKTHDDKKAYVQDVFSHIAKHYDMMNTLLSFNQDARWRRFAIAQLQLSEGMRIADIAVVHACSQRQRYKKFLLSMWRG